jgi:hypothetical protein
MADAFEFFTSIILDHETLALFYVLHKINTAPLSPFFLGEHSGASIFRCDRAIRVKFFEVQSPSSVSSANTAKSKQVALCWPPDFPTLTSFEPDNAEPSPWLRFMWSHLSKLKFFSGCR